MKSFTVGKNDEGQRLDKFLSKAIPNLPKSLMYKYIRTKKIKLNGKKADISTRLVAGDIIEAYIKDEFFAQSPKLDFTHAPTDISVVYEDENIILVDKEPGLLCHSDKSEQVNTLINRIQHYLYTKGEYNPAQETSFRPALANRIDRNTGGIVIAAKNAAALRILCEKIRGREIRKWYLAAVHGIPENTQDTLKGFLQKNAQKNKVFLQSRKTDENKDILTRYRLIKTKNNISLIEVELITGRPHQIRAHMASIGHPLLGDQKYGKGSDGTKLDLKYQALYSYRLKFGFNSDAGILSYLNGKSFQVKEVWFAKQLFGF